MTSTQTADNGAGLVNLAEFDPRLEIDLRYAREDNFTGVVLYPAARALLCPSAARRLSLVQDWLCTHAGGLVVIDETGRATLVNFGMRIKVWDAYRPLSVQRAMWEKRPDERFIAPPMRGSRHNRATAVDVTLCDEHGHDLEMPTDFDEFSDRAHVAFAGCSATAAANRDLLRLAMTTAGFVGICDEWWHFDAPDWNDHPLLDTPLI